MTDDEVRAWLTEEIEREERHAHERRANPTHAGHCIARRNAFRDLLGVMDRARPNLWARAQGAK